MHVLPTQQQQPHVVTKTPSPIRCPLFLDSNARRKPPGGKLKETSLTPMDHTHTPLEDECRLVLPIDFQVTFLEMMFREKEQEQKQQYCARDHNENARTICIRSDADIEQRWLNHLVPVGPGNFVNLDCVYQVMTRRRKCKPCNAPSGDMTAAQRDKDTE